MSVKESIRNAALTAGMRTFMRTNAPNRYETRQKQFYDRETTSFIEQYARYASDFFQAMAQGLNRDDPKLWETVYMRMADVGRAMATSAKLTDDYKRVLIANRSLDYIRPGTKFVTMGNTWLAINPNNISGVGAGGLVQRCNAVWNYLDWYGNVKSEPIAVDRYLARANNTDTQEAMNLTKGYFDVKCQLNEATKQLAENSRMILGRNCYRITGFSDFTQEFTGDYDSVRLLEFSIHFEEPNLTIDDMENHVAGGKKFSWDVEISGISRMTAGQTARFSARSRRMNETVHSTDEHPIFYIWESSDENVAEVDAWGNVTALGAGEAVITATLEQNPMWRAEMAVMVAPAGSDGTVQFLRSIPDRLSYGESATLEAAYFLNGEQTEEDITWQFEGADEASYTVKIEGNRAEISCWGGSVKTLRVIAYFAGHDGLFPEYENYPNDEVFPEDREEEVFASAEITLEGI